MGVIVIACYRPKPHQQDALRELMASHLPILRSQGLATERPSIIGESKDGTIVEVFEWVSEDAVAAAHENPVVGEMWKKFEAVCDYVPANTLPEASDMFAHLTPLDL